MCVCVCVQARCTRLHKETERMIVGGAHGGSGNLLRNLHGGDPHFRDNPATLFCNYNDTIVLGQGIESRVRGLFILCLFPRFVWPPIISTNSLNYNRPRNNIIPNIRMKSRRAINIISRKICTRRECIIHSYIYVHTYSEYFNGNCNRW